VRPPKEIPFLTSEYIRENTVFIKNIELNPEFKNKDNPRIGVLIRRLLALAPAFYTADEVDTISEFMVCDEGLRNVMALVKNAEALRDGRVEIIPHIFELVTKGQAE
jgi:hypothetical protein